MKNRSVILFSVICCALGGLIGEWAYAITPPPPVAPHLASVILTITPATVRADNVTPFAASEVKEYRLYFTQLTAYITAPPAASGPTTYTYIVPNGQCFKTTDAVAATTVDTGGLESAGSATVSATADTCSGKYPAGKPAVQITTGS
jgi:hypothetical protein